MKGRPLNIVYNTPMSSWRLGLSDPLRGVIFIMTCLVLGYGARVDNGSPLTVFFLESAGGAFFTGLEFVLLGIGLFEIFRRLVRSEYELSRTPLFRPLVAVGIVLFVVPLVRMFITEGGFRFPLELTGFPLLLLAFVIWLHAYKRQDLPLMAWLVVAAGLFKGIEGIAIYLARPISWGLLTGWRDACLLTMMVFGSFYAFIIKPGNDKVYRRIRLFLLLTFPISIFTFINSTRRSYILGAALAIVVLLFYLRREERRRFSRALPVLLIVGVSAAFVTDFDKLVDRLSVISNPSSEGSAIYRVIEVYNISVTISERPIFGWPFGSTWKNHTNLEFENISSLIPHNVYLYILWRSGAVGLAIWIWFLITLIRMHHRTLRQAEAPFQKFMAFWLAATSISVMMASFTMPLVTDRLQNFFPFIFVMTGFLPGAYPAKWRRFVLLPSRRPVAGLAKESLVTSVDIPTESDTENRDAELGG